MMRMVREDKRDKARENAGAQDKWKSQRGEEKSWPDVPESSRVTQRERERSNRFRRRGGRTIQKPFPHSGQIISFVGSVISPGNRRMLTSARLGGGDKTSWVVWGDMDGRMMMLAP